MEPAQDFDESDTLIRVLGGNIEIDSLNMGDPQNRVSALIEVENGKLGIGNSVLRKRIVQRNGELTLEKSALRKAES